MQYTKLGNSDLTVSRICMGCMGFGDPEKGQHKWTLGERETEEIIRAGLAAGINFYDTASAYQGGSSEEYVGKALRANAKREDYVLATKFLPRTPQEIEAGISGKEHVLNSLDASLKRLGMDYADLYICHMWDYNTPLEEIMEGLDAAVKSGKARAIGISNCFAWQIAKANYFARANGMAEYVSIQGHYNLIAREEEREMVPFCKEENIALTPYSALAAGRLCRLPGTDAASQSKRLKEDAYAKFKYDQTAEMDNAIIARVAEVAASRGVGMTEIALAWLLTKVTAPVVGATKLSQLEGMAKATELNLTAEECRYLEELYLPHPLVGVMAQNK